MKRIINNYKIEKQIKKRKQIKLVFIFGIIGLLFSLFNLGLYMNVLSFEEVEDIEYVYKAKLNNNKAIMIKHKDGKVFSTVFYEYCRPLTWGGCRKESQSVYVQIK
jgi:hypothetical protein